MCLKSLCGFEVDHELRSAFPKPVTGYEHGLEIRINVEKKLELKFSAWGLSPLLNDCAHDLFSHWFKFQYKHFWVQVNSEGGNSLVQMI